MSDLTPRQDTLFVASLAKGLKLLRAFDESHTDMALTELAARAGLDRSATQRLANTLHQEGFLEKDPLTRRFRPSHAWLELAYAYFWSDPLTALASPKLIELSNQVGRNRQHGRAFGERHRLRDAPSKPADAFRRDPGGPPDSGADHLLRGGQSFRPCPPTKGTWPSATGRCSSSPR